MKTVIVKNISIEKENEIKEWFNYVESELYYCHERAIQDDEIFLIHDGLTMYGEKMYYIVFERVAATTWTNETNVYFSNNESFIQEFIEERE